MNAIGCPDIDIMMSDKLPQMTQVRDKYEIAFEQYHLVLFHPVTTEYTTMYQQAHALVEAILLSEDQFIIVYPNNDPGTNDILRAYEPLVHNEKIKLFPSIRFEYFLVLIKNAMSLIGNSSAGMHEAPIYGVPSINIGTRQSNRYQGKSIINCESKRNNILNAINKVKHLSLFQPTQYFGTGESAKLFKQALMNEKFWQVNPQKMFVDL